MSTLGFRPARSWEDQYPEGWPPKEFFQPESRLSIGQFEELRKLVDMNAGERMIDQFIRANPAVLTVALRSAATGHHGAWVLSQQMIRPKLGKGRYGLIPDFIIGGKNSDGFKWWDVELKGADARLFCRKQRTLQFSNTLNGAVCQLLSYIDYCSEAQATLRDEFKLVGLREPNGMILIGREDELNDDGEKQKLKSAWNRIAKTSLEIRTYDSLLRSFKHVLADRANLEKAVLT